MRLSTFGLVGGSGGLAGTLGFGVGFATALGASAAGLAAILVGAIGFAGALTTELVGFFCVVSSLRVAFERCSNCGGLRRASHLAAGRFVSLRLGRFGTNGGFRGAFCQTSFSRCGLAGFRF